MFKDYIKLFNEQDDEIYKTMISNDEAFNWLSEEIPFFECPDKVIEKTYYYRWWIYRKHLKKTTDGYVITEFLPKVYWSGKYNTISAAAGHHIYEGRWLKNGEKYLTDYINFLLEDENAQNSYSTWLLYGAKKLSDVKNSSMFNDIAVKRMCDYYDRWEKTHMTQCGLFWSYDNYDAMEFSISGTKNMQAVKGLRPTLNSYMYGGAEAIAYFAENCGNHKICCAYKEKAKKIKRVMLKYLTDDGFFKAFHPDNGGFSLESGKIDFSDTPKELIGYIPWYFNIPPKGAENAFLLLQDKKTFQSSFGLTTADISDRRFLYKADHECLWNGYVWPFATSQTLTALANVIFDYNCKEQYERLFISLLRQFALQHTRISDDGNEIMWIDEVRHPLKNEWTSREILKNQGWKAELGGIERGKDYNHSTFCDLVISGIMGVRTDGANVSINPIIPLEWDYLKLDNLYIHGKKYKITFDRYGTHYGQKKGLIIECFN